MLFQLALNRFIWRLTKQTQHVDMLVGSFRAMRPSIKSTAAGMPPVGHIGKLC